MKFNVINTQEDIDYLMKKFFYFHDSCIKELKYYSGGYVAENRGMFPFNSKRNVSMIFQSQKGEYSAIEVQFESVKRMNLEPRPENHDCIIYESSLIKINELFYWSEWGDFTINDIDTINRTWISSQKVKWRALDGAMGESELYISTFGKSSK